MARGKSKRGFAAMSKQRVKEIASKGGQASRGKGRLSRGNKSSDEDKGTDQGSSMGGTWSGY